MKQAKYSIGDKVTFRNYPVFYGNIVGIIYDRDKDWYAYSVVVYDSYDHEIEKSSFPEEVIRPYDEIPRPKFKHNDLVKITDYLNRFYAIVKEIDYDNERGYIYGLDVRFEDDNALFEEFNIHQDYGEYFDESRLVRRAEDYFIGMGV